MRVAGITSRFEACNNEGSVDLNSLISTMTWKKKKKSKLDPTDLKNRFFFTTHSRGFSVQFSPTACSSRTDGLDNSIIRPVFTIVSQSKEHRLEKKFIDLLKATTLSDKRNHIPLVL